MATTLPEFRPVLRGRSTGTTKKFVTRRKPSQVPAYTTTLKLLQTRKSEDCWNSTSARKGSRIGWAEGDEKDQAPAALVRAERRAKQ